MCGLVTALVIKASTATLLAIFSREDTYKPVMTLTVGYEVYSGIDNVCGYNSNMASSIGILHMWGPMPTCTALEALHLPHSLSVL